MRFYLKGIPIPKKRHRTCIVGRHARTYDPQEKQKNKTKDFIKNEMNKNEYEQIKDGPIAVTIVNYVPIPASFSKKKQATLCGMPCSKRPDIDNYVKYLLDACNDVVYKDDGQIAQLYSAKIYSENPGMTIEVEKIDYTQTYGTVIEECPSSEQIINLIKRANLFGMQGKTISNITIKKSVDITKITYNVT